MPGSCMTFFAGLTNTLVAAGHLDGKKTKTSSVNLGSAITSALPNDCPYSDTYVIKIEKLIPLEQQEKLKEVFGPGWVGIVNGMYKSIEREMHDETIRKFSGLKAADGGKNE